MGVGFSAEDQHFLDDRVEAFEKVKPEGHAEEVLASLQKPAA